MVKFLSRYFFVVYIGIWVLYQLQDILLLKGMAAQLLLAVFMAMSLCMLCLVNIYYRTSPYVKWLNIMLVILTIYGLVPIVGNYTFHKSNMGHMVSNYLYLQNIYKSVLPIYGFYYFTMKNRITPQNVNYIFLGLLIYCILSYYQSFFLRTELYDKSEVTNNTGYQFVPLILMLYLLRIRDLWKYVFLIVIMGYVMMAMKRGAILTGSVAAVSYIAYRMRKASRQQVIYVVGLSIASLYLVYQYVMNLYATSSYFQVRLRRTLSGDSSGRDRIYLHYLDYFTDRSTGWEFLFGHGAAGTIDIFGQWAHNDWLEFAINQGVFGILLYIVYWLVFGWEWWGYQGQPDYKRALRDCIIVYFLVSLFSMSFNGMPLAAALCIGYCMAKNPRNRGFRIYPNESKENPTGTGL